MNDRDICESCLSRYDVKAVLTLMAYIPNARWDQCRPGFDNCNGWSISPIPYWELGIDHDNEDLPRVPK